MFRSKDSLPFYIYIFLLALTPLIRSFGAIDVLAPQWLYLSFLNTVFFIFLFYKKTPIEFSLTSCILSFLVLLSFISVSYSTNRSESLIVISRLLIFFHSFINLSVSFKKIYPLFKIEKLIIIVFTIISLIEVSVSINFFLDIFSLGDSIGRLREFAGLAYNVNIGAFSMLFKLPILLYVSFLNSSSKYVKLFYTLLSICIIFAITLTGSRGAFLGLVFIFISLLIFFIYNKNLKLILSLFFLVFSSFFINFFLFSNSSESNQLVTSRLSNIVDYSSISRSRFYIDALTQTFTYPYLGTGIGTYKIESLYYERNFTDGYTVPYNTHNDFLQFGFELGVPGFLLYFLFIISIFYFSFKSFKFSFISFFFLLSLSIFFLDSNLNFPFHRPIIVVQFLILASFLCLKFANIKLNKYFTLIFILFSFSTVYISAKVNTNYIDQQILLASFNESNYKSFPISRIETINHDFPNITVTSLPIAALKSLYYIESNQLDIAKDLLFNSMEVNPYIGFNEDALGQIYFKENKIDSALYFAKKAFNKYPNTTHSTRYQKYLELVKDYDSLDESFSKIESRNNEVEWQNYLAVYGASKFDYDSIVFQRAKKSLELFPNNKVIMRYANFILTPKESLEKAYELDRFANDYFVNKDYVKSVEFWKKALSILPSEEPYIDNICKSYIANLNFNEVISFINTLDEEFLANNEKYNYYKAVSLINIGEIQNGCRILYNSAKNGYKDSSVLYKQICN